MSYYFRERPRFGERFRGKSGDELLQELKQQLDEERPFFETGQTNGSPRTRDPFERHTSFPRGFPFDDEGFGRRADIRTHLDDLAARHPEFADHLNGPLWGDVPFPTGGGSLHRNRNRRSSTDRPGNNQHSDEDARSQTSGGSGVSSHGSEPDTNDHHQHQHQHQPKSQAGLRNHTLDIGQHQHNMENPQQQRNVRSMSAPPENRNNQANEHGNPRFVSRVEITPQSQEKSGGQQSQPQQQQQQQQSDKLPGQKAQPQTQPQQSQAGNVRHIPIFVEGRDEPVIPKGPASTNATTTNTHTATDEPDFPRRQQSPPHFHRPSHFSQQHFNKQTPSGWPHFQRDPFFEHSTREWPSRHQSPFSSFRQPAQPEKSRSQQTHHPEPPPQQTQRQKPQQQHPEPEAQPEAPPKPRQQVQPKDPLEKVALVQKEVDSLAEQVRQYTGKSRQDKQYMYLDEMLTRELIKLDDIDTEGKENVRQTRKQAIRSIQETISLLESKVPLPGQQQTQPEEQTAQQPAEDKPAQNGIGEEKPAEAMDTTTEVPSASEEQKAIPLPPPSSPTKVATPETQPVENSASKIEEPQQPSEIKSESTEAPQLVPQAQAEAATPQADNPSQELQKEVGENKPAGEPMELSSNSPAAPQQQADQEKMEVRQSSPVKELPPTNTVEPLKSESETPAQPELTVEKPEEQKKEEQKQPAPETKDVKADKPKKEPPPVPAKPGKSPKKAKKTPKKQPEPVSETAIPMPAPGQ